MKIGLKANEMVVKVANTMFINSSLIAGKLILTNQRIYFIGKEDDQHNQEIQPADIQEIIPFYTLAFIPNGLNIVTKKGEQLKFKIKNRKSWEQILNKIY